MQRSPSNFLMAHGPLKKELGYHNLELW